MEDLTGRVAVVTGGGSGIGRGIAHALAAAGATVAVADIEADAAETVGRQLAGNGAKARGYRVDVTDPASLEALAEAVEADLGPVAMICNNAGVLVQGRLVESPAEDWQWVLSVNVMGVVHGIREFVPRMRAHGNGGHVLNTASMAGIAPRLDGELGIYSSSKAAIVVLSEILREELAADGIGVTALCPGPVNTRFWSSARNRPAQFGPGEEIPVPDRAREGADPMEVGRLAIEGVRANRAFVYTSENLADRVQERVARLVADVIYR
jgi:NAD(P)-dependent dehydrogenase (short-subunit alcohol dehydrogenase family)